MYTRWMIRKDIDRVLEIDSRSVHFTKRWSEGELISIIRQRNAIGMAIENEHGKVVGFMVYELYKHHLYVERLVVEYEHRNMGYGRFMIENLIGKLSPDRRQRIIIDIEEDNVDAQLFLKSLGLQGRPNGEYVEMTYELSESGVDKDEN